MTANRRIFWNVVATYGRSVYALAIGLFSARWGLNALGHSDYGLYGLVGGLTAFVVFFNNLLASAVSRFYAYAVGQAATAKTEASGVEEVRHWFSIALAIHTLWPLLLVAVGYPIGSWAVRDFLSIPADRIGSCVWVWRFTCLSCFVAMVNVPFQAMYTAKQYIAELTIYSFATTTLNAVFLYYIYTHEGTWLTAYAAWMCAMSVIPQVIIGVRAVLVFPECRFRISYVPDWQRIASLLKFAGMNFVGAISQLFSHQGLNIAVNKYLGASKNAAMSIASTVNVQAANLSSALFGAFQPAITNAAGAGDYDRMRGLVYRVCSLGTFGIMVFALPLIIEADEVLRLWLKTPPEGAATLCVYYLVVRLIERISDGHWVAIFAMGRIAAFRIAESAAYWSMLGLAIALLSLGWGVSGVGVALVAGRAASAVIKLWYGRKEAGLSVPHWLRRTFLPALVVIGVALAVGYVPHVVLEPSILRIAAVTAACELCIIGLSWRMLLDAADRDVVSRKVNSFLKRTRRAG